MSRTVYLVGLAVLVGIGVALWRGVLVEEVPQQSVVHRPRAHEIKEIQWVPIKILRGTTIEDISRYTNISVKEILRRNPGLRSRVIPEGTTIFLPRVKGTFNLPPIMEVKASMVKSLGNDVVAILHYHPRPGDTVLKIIKKFRTTADLLEAVNPADSLATLVEKGKVIYVPIRSRKLLELPKGTFRYKVRPGDTLWGIMRRFHVTKVQLENVNPDYDLTRLRAGTYINIPRDIDQASQ